MDKMILKRGINMKNNQTKEEYAIIVDDVSKRFKIYYDKPNTLKERLVFWKNSKTDYHNVLKNISLKINKGESVALVGVNGSGKSTLLKLMTKIIYPNKGTVETRGKLTSLLELGAGFHPDFSGRENIYFNASIALSFALVSFALTAPTSMVDRRLYSKNRNTSAILQY